jgi:D-glycero-D-manno-heptose 1,7-bisphosphate phosphatase
MLIMLDRDGVLNEDRPDFVRSPAELKLIAGAAHAVSLLNRAGCQLVVCTNQSCVGRGLIDHAMLERIHAELQAQLSRHGARLDAILVATDAPENASPRRKPGPGMLQEALAQFRQIPGDAVYIGDSLGDLQAAKAAGCQRILVRTGKGSATEARGLPADLAPILVFDDLAAVADHLLGPSA